MYYIDDDGVKVKAKRIISPEQAVVKLMGLCSKSEKCSNDLTTLMNRWEIDKSIQPQILNRLKSDKYYDNLRYAKAFVRDKMRFSGWGKHKIIMGLRMKGIEPDDIDIAISEELKETDLSDKLENAIKNKMRNIKYKDDYDLKNKLLRFAASRGYDFAEAMEVVNRVINKK